MLVAWSEHVQVKMMGNNEYNMEMQVVSEDEKERFWVTFVHVSTDAKGKTMIVGGAKEKENVLR